MKDINQEDYTQDFIEYVMTRRMQLWCDIYNAPWAVTTESDSSAIRSTKADEAVNAFDKKFGVK